MWALSRPAVGFSRPQAVLRTNRVPVSIIKPAFLRRTFTSGWKQLPKPDFSHSRVVPVYAGSNNADAKVAVGDEFSVQEYCFGQSGL